MIRLRSLDVGVMAETLFGDEPGSAYVVEDFFDGEFVDNLLREALEDEGMYYVTRLERIYEDAVLSSVVDFHHARMSGRVDSEFMRYSGGNLRLSHEDEGLLAYLSLDDEGPVRAGGVRVDENKPGSLVVTSGRNEISQPWGDSSEMHHAYVLREYLR